MSTNLILFLLAILMDVKGCIQTWGLFKNHVSAMHNGLDQNHESDGTENGTDGGTTGASMATTHESIEQCVDHSSCDTFSVGDQ